jgi:uncharacterized protein (DUF362 family)
MRFRFKGIKNIKRPYYQFFFITGSEVDVTRRSFKMETKVSIVKGSKNPQADEIRAMTQKAIDLIGGMGDIVSKGSRVLIKPNIAYTIKPGETEVTDPMVSKAIYDILTDMGANPVIAESSAAGVDGEAAFEAAGYYALRDQGY